MDVSAQRQALRRRSLCCVLRTPCRCCFRCQAFAFPSPSMYLKKSQWWVCPVLSLLSAAARATPTVGGTSLPASFSQGYDLAATNPSYVPWPLREPTAAPEHGLPQNLDSPAPTSASHSVAPPSSTNPASVKVSGFSFLDGAELPPYDATLGMGASIDSRQLKFDREAGTAKGRRSAENVGTSRFQTSSSLRDDSRPVDSDPDRLASSDLYDNGDVFSVVHSGSPIVHNGGSAGTFTGESATTPGSSAAMFTSPIFDADSFHPPPPTHARRVSPFWEFSAWRRVNAKPSEVILLTDVDDTLWSSGGWRIASCPIGGVDKEFRRGEGYPGIAALLFVLAAGRHVTAAADPPAQPTNYLLPRCPSPGVRFPLLELCPSETSTHPPRGPISPLNSGFHAVVAESFTSGATTATKESTAPFTEEFLPPASALEADISQPFPGAAVFPFSSPFLLGKKLLRSAPPAAFCAAGSFAPATGFRRPDPTQCRRPLTLPPAVGLLTARVSTSLVRGLTRSSTFYYDIDWQLEHGARMIYGPNIFPGAWPHGFENDVELMRDAIGGQHSRGRAKVQGFKSALQAGMRPAAQVSASFAAARLRMASQESTSPSGRGGGQQGALTSSVSSDSLSKRYRSQSQRSRGIERIEIPALKGRKGSGHSMVGTPPTRTTQQTQAPSDSGSRGGLTPVSDVSAGGNANGESWRDGKNRGASVKTVDALPIAEFAQAIHFSKASVSKRAVPLVFGDTGEKDLEVAASVAALAYDRLAAVFSHVVFADRETEKLEASLQTASQLPRGATPITFEFNGQLRHAIQLRFDVIVRLGPGAGPAPTSLADLTDAQAYAVGTRIAAYLRDCITQHVRVHLVQVSSMDEMLHGTTNAPAKNPRENAHRGLPLLFVQFSRVVVEGVEQSSPRSLRSGFSSLLSRVHRHLKRKVSEFTTSTADDDGPAQVHVIPVVPSEPENLDPLDYGVPIVPYRTTIAAATGALLLRMITLQDLVNVILATVRDLRSLGPLSSCSNVEILEDHLYDLLVVENLIGSRIQKEAVQHYEAYVDATAAMRTFYHASRFCARLSRAVVHGRPASLREDPGSRFAEAEMSVESNDVALGELRLSPSFEECFTAFALTMRQRSAVGNSSESPPEARQQRSVPRRALGLQSPVDIATDYLGRQAPGVLTLARVACRFLPQLQHWRSAGAAELEVLSAEWSMALSQAVLWSKTPPVNASQRNAAGGSSRIDAGGGGLLKGGSLQTMRWKNGVQMSRRLSALFSSDPVYRGPAGFDEDNHIQSREYASISPSLPNSGGRPSRESTSVPSLLPVGDDPALVGFTSGASITDARRRDLRSTTSQRHVPKRENQDGIRKDTQSPAKEDGLVGGFPGAGIVGSGGRLTDSLLPERTAANAVLFHTANDGVLAPSRRESRLPRRSSRDLTARLKNRPKRSGAVRFRTEDSRSPVTARTTSARNGESRLASDESLDGNITCPAIYIHSLIRVMRPICSAQRRRFGEHAPCAVLTRLLYNNYMLTTFNAIQVWIKGGSLDPLYLENVGVTLDPARPKGGRHLSRLASTVVEKSEGHERYRVQEARAGHEKYTTMLPFFVDPACNPFS